MDYNIGKSTLKYKKIYLLRHGETEFNREGRCQGILDSPLTDKGREQAESNGKLLNELLRDVSTENMKFYSSPLGRTRESTKIVLNELENKNIKILYDEDIQEGNLGEWGGRKVKDILSENPNMDFSNFSWYFNSPKGENYFDIEKRCSKFLKKVEKLKEENIVIISHGLLGIVLRAVLLDLEYEDILNFTVPQNGLFLINNGKMKFIEGI